MSQRANQAGEGPGIRNVNQHERHCSEYSAFARELSILIGEKWQALLIWPKPVAIIEHKHVIASENPSVAFILEAFPNLSIDANNLIDLKHEQKIRIQQIFQLLATRWSRGVPFQCCSVSDMPADRINSRLGREEKITWLRFVLWLKMSKIFPRSVICKIKTEASTCNLLSSLLMLLYWLIIWHKNLTSSEGLYSKHNSVRAGSHSYRLASFADGFARVPPAITAC